MLTQKTTTNIFYISLIFLTIFSININSTYSYIAPRDCKDASKILSFWYCYNPIKLVWPPFPWTNKQTAKFEQNSQTALYSGIFDKQWCLSKSNEIQSIQTECDKASQNPNTCPQNANGDWILYDPCIISIAIDYWKEFNSDTIKYLASSLCAGCFHFDESTRLLPSSWLFYDKITNPETQSLNKYAKIFIEMTKHGGTFDITKCKQICSNMTPLPYYHRCDVACLKVDSFYQREIAPFY